MQKFEWTTSNVLVFYFDSAYFEPYLLQYISVYRMMGKKDFKFAKINIHKNLFASGWMMMTGTVNLFYQVDANLLQT